MEGIIVTIVNREEMKKRLAEVLDHHLLDKIFYPKLLEQANQIMTTEMLIRVIYFTLLDSCSRPVTESISVGIPAALGIPMMCKLPLLAKAMIPANNSIALESLENIFRGLRQSPTKFEWFRS